MNLALFFRKKREGINSIETVFNAIDDDLAPHKKVTLPYEGASAWTLLRNILYAFHHRSKVNHITGDAHYIALALGRKTVLTIHDVQSALNVRNVLKRWYILWMWFYLPALMVSKITVISEFTRKELSRIIPFAKKKIVVVYNPFDAQIGFHPERILPPSPRVLHIGTKSNKNLERVAEALQGINCHLIVLGKMSPHQRELMNLHGIEYENHYDLPYHEVIEHYRRCSVVSFPSMYEGFGMPILEANAAGKPVLAGDIEVLHEVAGKAAYFVNPYDVQEIRNGFKELFSNAGLRNDLIELGRVNIQRFMPERIAASYKQIYGLL